MKNILVTLAFYVKYSKENEPQSFTRKDRGTKNAIKSLEKRGFLKVDWKLNQAYFTGKTINSIYDK